MALWIPTCQPAGALDACMWTWQLVLAVSILGRLAWKLLSWNPISPNPAPVRSTPGDDDGHPLPLYVRDVTLGNEPGVAASRAERGIVDANAIDVKGAIKESEEKLGRCIVMVVGCVKQLIL